MLLWKERIPTGQIWCQPRISGTTRPRTPHDPQQTAVHPPSNDAIRWCCKFQWPRCLPCPQSTPTSASHGSGSSSHHTATTDRQTVGSKTASTWNLWGLHQPQCCTRHYVVLTECPRRSSLEPRTVPPSLSLRQTHSS